MGKRKRMRLTEKDQDKLGIKFDKPIPKAIKKRMLVVKKGTLAKKTSIWVSIKNLFGL